MKSSLPSIVQFNGVSLSYENGPDVLKDITFSLAPGSFYFLTGESGAGKSSLLSLMYLARRPTKGNLSVFGTEVNLQNREKLPDIRRNIGVVFQDFRLLDHLSARENVALPLRVLGVREAEIQRHVKELLNWVGLANHIDAKPPTLSGGQQQRVAIARALINRPKLLLADEPTGNVDDKMAARLIKLLIELNKIGTAVVIATHNENLIKKFNFPRMHLSMGRLKVLPPVGQTSIRSINLEDS
jgi:cell division transport system ATP-binding protein